MVLDESSSSCFVEVIRQESPKRKTLIQFFSEQERVETKFELASIKSENLSSGSCSESEMQLEDFFCNGSSPPNIETSKLRAAELKEDLAWDEVYSKPTPLISSELSEIREGYESEEISQQAKKRTPNPTSASVVNDRHAWEIISRAHSSELSEIRQGYEIEEYKEETETDSSESIGEIDGLRFQKNPDISNQTPSLELSDFSYELGMEEDSTKDEKISTPLIETIPVVSTIEAELKKIASRENIRDLSAKEDDKDQNQNPYLPNNTNNDALATISTVSKDKSSCYHINFPVNAPAQPKHNEALKLSISKREDVRRDQVGAKKLVTSAVRISKMSPNISQGNMNRGMKLCHSPRDSNWHRRLYQQGLDRSSRLLAERVTKSENNEQHSSWKKLQTISYAQYAIGNNKKRIPLERRSTYSQMFSKMPIPKVFERLSRYQKVSCEGPSQGQEPVSTKTRKQDLKQLDTPQACERLYQLGKARQRQKRETHTKAHDKIRQEEHYPCFFHSRKDYHLERNMSKETSTTVASLESTNTVESSVYDRLYYFAQKDRKKRTVEETSKRLSRTKGHRRLKGKAKDQAGDCDSTVYNRLYETGKTKQVEGKRRRQQIEQAIAAKHAIPDWSDWTIPLDRAEDYYHKSISRALSHERKMVLAAYKMGLKYEPKYSFSTPTLERYGWR